MDPTADAAAPTDATVPAPVETVIDLDHLAHMTLGEADLEAEVLTLFARQAAILLVRMREAPPAAVAAFAHTLKGSACGIGRGGSPMRLMRWKDCARRTPALLVRRRNWPRRGRGQSRDRRSLHAAL